MSDENSKILLCLNCRKDLSTEVKLSKGKINNIDNTSPVQHYHTPRGNAVVYVKNEKSCPEKSEELFTWMNGNDLIQKRLDTSDAIGCCGLNGRVKCNCGSIIGKIYTDCCGPHFFEPNLTNTYFYDSNKAHIIRSKRIYTEESKVTKINVSRK